MLLRVVIIALLVISAGPAWAQRWVTSWAAPSQGPYPAGNAIAQPDLKFALPDKTVRDQTFRMIVRPSVWGKRVRVRFSNLVGTQPLDIDGGFIGLQMAGATVTTGTNRPVTFKGKKTITIPPGGDAWSDAVTLPFVADPAANELQGRKLAISFHVASETRAATWHALAMQTSYITAASAGALGELEDDSAFPNSTTSWFFVDALDIQAGPDISAVVALGDSITDGAGSTLNGDDRWPDMLSRRLLAAGFAMGVVDAGISGNHLKPSVAGTTPTAKAAETAAAGGPAALDRLDRDVLGLSGVTHVILLEGMNDLAGPTSFEQVRDGIKEAVKRIRAKIKGVKILGATLTPIAGAGSPDQDIKRRALNDFIRDSGGTFDGVVEFDKATVDRTSGGLRPEFIPSSTIGGAGDFLHPNRAGYMAMGDAIDLRMLHAPAPPKPKPRPRPTEDEGTAG